MLTNTSQPSLPLEKVERVAVAWMLPGLGDFLCAVPAWRALRAAWPGARVTLIGLDSTRDLARRFGHYLDDYLTFPGFPGLEEVPFRARDLPPFLAAVHANPFDLVVQMHGSGVTSNLFALLLGGHVTAGHYPPGHYRPNPRYFLPYRDGQSEVRRLLHLMDFLGCAPQGEHLEFPIEAADDRAFAALVDRYLLRPGAYICLHPGASRPDRRWSAEQFAAVGDQLAGLGFQIVLTGVAAEADITTEVAARMAHTSLDLTGQTPLGALALLLRGARLLVCNDTGISHLASAVQTPSVVLFTTSELPRWAPLDTTRHRALDLRALRGDATQAVADEARSLLALTETEVAVV